MQTLANSRGIVKMITNAAQPKKIFTYLKDDKWF
jgi:rRNA processing protein Krr1/Pno1